RTPAPTHRSSRFRAADIRAAVWPGTMPPGLSCAFSQTGACLSVGNGAAVALTPRRDQPGECDGCDSRSPVGCPGAFLANVVSIPGFQAARLGRGEGPNDPRIHTVRDI